MSRRNKYWINGIFEYFSTNLPIIFENWYADEPNNFNDAEDCVNVGMEKLENEKIRYGKWADNSCNKKLQSVCVYCEGIHS